MDVDALIKNPYHFIKEDYKTTKMKIDNLTVTLEVTYDFIEPVPGNSSSKT